MSNQKFIVDAMLGNIVKKLRLFGYDAKYFSDIDDEKIICLAKKEDRIVLTRDKDLVNKTKKEKVQNVLLESTIEMEQLIQIGRVLCFEGFSIDINKARCSICNERIESVTREKVLEEIPKGVKQNKDFWICRKCDKVYWRGTHIEKLEEFTERLNERL